ncbi:MarR family winged helix-turn-helix transcriptional regulator [Kitasatospora azatica]|uniref:MarR family winged helix-turn-helix transcriptional regulator n=1 Tax=Kitasatospora azatica TaxID=58347 RepID=UPI000690ED0A|nr:MarR family transcriptional regulator [Kitasatospora azatica]
MDHPDPAPAISLDRLARQATRLAQLVNSATQAAAAEAGLTHADADVLLALHEAPERRLRPTGLATACGLSSGGTSNVINRLAQGGYVNREANEADGRSSWVRLTEEGAALAGKVTAVAAVEHEHLLDRLPEGVPQALGALLETVLGQLESANGRGAAVSAGRRR